MSHSITINQGAVKYLADMLNSTGWAKTTADIIIGGGLLATKLELPDFPSPEAKETVGEFNTRCLPYMKTGFPALELTDKERDCARRCLDYYVKEGRLAPSSFTRDLLLAFGYTD